MNARWQSGRKESFMRHTVEVPRRVRKGGVCHEEEVYGGADRLCPQAVGTRHTGGGGDPQDGQTFYRWKTKYEGLGSKFENREGR